MVGSHRNNWGGRHTISMPFASASWRVWTSRRGLEPSRKSTTVGLGFCLDEEHTEKPFTENVRTTPHIPSGSAVDAALFMSKPLSSHFLVTPKQHRHQGHTGCTYTPYQSNVLPLIPALPPHLVASPPCVHPLNSVAEVQDLERRLIHVVDISWVVIDGHQSFLDTVVQKLPPLLGC